jgi:hypothetical protein
VLPRRSGPRESRPGHGGTAWRCRRSACRGNGSAPPPGRSGRRRKAGSGRRRPWRRWPRAPPRSRPLPRCRRSRAPGSWAPGGARFRSRREGSSGDPIRRSRPPRPAPGPPRLPAAAPRVPRSGGRGARGERPPSSRPAPVGVPCQPRTFPPARSSPNRRNRGGSRPRPLSRPVKVARTVAPVQAGATPLSPEATMRRFPSAPAMRHLGALPQICVRPTRRAPDQPFTLA